jgi:hypothetical protein
MKSLLLYTGVFFGLQFAFPQNAHAVPAFARQTGMNCNSCHIGTYYIVPNFTRTGRLFAMRGYQNPYVRERLHAEGDTGNNNENSKYGGDYLALNWTDFFSARLISEFARGGKDASGNSLDVKSSPLNRMALFFTGAITDWLGLWTEIGYLGNNSLRSVTPGRQNEQTGLNYFAYDEYRINAAWDFGKNSFYGFSLGNEHPNVGPQFQYPLPLPDLWSNGQGGVGRSMNMANLSAFMFYKDRLYLQVAGVTGADNTNWSDGKNFYANVSYDWFRKTRNDLWLIGEYYGGTDFPSIMSPIKDSFLCTGTCPPGVTDQNFSINNGPGYSILNAPLERVKDFDSFRLSLEHSAADRGVHTWYAAVAFLTMRQNFESGGKVEDTLWGAYLRYFYTRTYGLEVYVRDHLKYEYTTPAGLKRDTFTKTSYGITFLWYPAMNVDFWLSYSPRIQNIVFKDERRQPSPDDPLTSRDLYSGKASSFVLGMEYNF